MKHISRFLFSTLLTLCVSPIMGQLLSPFNAGTVSPNDSIVIYYDVTINNFCGCTQISNQGAITGSNFSNLFTDDPETGTSSDPTITFLNMFPLPVNLLEFIAQRSNNGISLIWKASETDVKQYEVERSPTGSTYLRIATIQSSGNGLNLYQSIDGSPLGGKNYYRLKMIDENGSIKYSHVLVINLDTHGTTVKLYPNPVIGKSAVLQYSNLPSGDYRIEFVSSLGQVQLQRQLRVQSNNATETLRLEALSGLYFVRIVGTGGLVYSSIIMVE